MQELTLGVQDVDLVQWTEMSSRPLLKSPHWLPILQRVPSTGSKPTSMSSKAMLAFEHRSDLRRYKLCLACVTLRYSMQSVWITNLKRFVASGNEVDPPLDAAETAATGEPLAKSTEQPRKAAHKAKALRCSLLAAA